MSIKNADVMNQIEIMLQNIKEKDSQQYKIIKSLLQEVYLEYNSGRMKGIDRKLYDMIDAEVNYKIQKGTK